MDKTIDLNTILVALKKNLIFIFGMPILFVAASIAITLFFITPKYTSSLQVIVNQKKVDSQFQAQQVQSDLQLINTYSEIIKSPRILDKVSEKLDHKYSQKRLAEMISVSNQTESKVLNISVTSNRPSNSKQVANTTAKVFQKEIEKIMDVDNVAILSVAENGIKTSPNIVLNAAIGLVLGIVFALLLTLIKEVTDKRIRSEKEVEELLDLPVIGVINRF